SACGLTTMLRNLKQLNSLPSFPTLFCTKKTGPSESRFIIQAKIGNSQLRIPRITRVEIRRSNVRLKIIIIMYNGGSRRKVAYRGGQPMALGPRSYLYGITTEHIKSHGLF